MQKPVDSRDITAIKLKTANATLNFFNIYNDGTHSRKLAALSRSSDVRTCQSADNIPDHIIWLGDFNRHHPMWHEACNCHLFTSANLVAAQILLDLLATFDMAMVLPAGLPTLIASGTKNYTRPNNVSCNWEFADNFITCSTDPDSRPPATDHLPIYLPSTWCRPLLL